MMGEEKNLELLACEIEALDKCHSILEGRFNEAGITYDKTQKERCEWWLLGILRFDGLEKMMWMAKNAPFKQRRKLI